MDNPESMKHWDLKKENQNTSPPKGIRLKEKRRISHNDHKTIIRAKTCKESINKCRVNSDTKRNIEQSTFTGPHPVLLYRSLLEIHSIVSAITEKFFFNACINTTIMVFFYNLAVTVHCHCHDNSNITRSTHWMTEGMIS